MQDLLISSQRPLPERGEAYVKGAYYGNEGVKRYKGSFDYQ